LVAEANGTATMERVSMRVFSSTCEKKRESFVCLDNHGLA